MSLEDVPSVDIMIELLHRMKCSFKTDKSLILIGPTGSGKGTHSSVMKDEYCLCHLVTATGDMLRAREAASVSRKDEEAMGKLQEMLQRQGTKLDKVLNFAADEAIFEERITGRRIHPPGGAIYHSKFAPPKCTAALMMVVGYYSKKGAVAHIPAGKPYERACFSKHY